MGFFCIDVFFLSLFLSPPHLRSFRYSLQIAFFTFSHSFSLSTPFFAVVLFLLYVLILWSREVEAIALNLTHCTAHTHTHFFSSLGKVFVVDPAAAAAADVHCSGMIP